jgi:hypothetical protein
MAPMAAAVMVAVLEAVLLCTCSIAQWGALVSGPQASCSFGQVRCCLRLELQLLDMAGPSSAWGQVTCTLLVWTAGSQAGLLCAQLIVAACAPSSLL